MDNKDKWHDLAVTWVKSGEVEKMNLRALVDAMKPCFPTHTAFLRAGGSIKDVLCKGLSDRELFIFYEPIPRKVRGVTDDFAEMRVTKNRIECKLNLYFKNLEEYMFPCENPSALRQMEREAYLYSMKVPGTADDTVIKKKRGTEDGKDGKDGKKKAKTDVTFSSGVISTTTILKQAMTPTSVLFLEYLMGDSTGRTIVDLFNNVYVKMNFRSISLSQIPCDRVTVANLSDFLGKVASKELRPNWFLINPLISILDVIRTMTTMFYAKVNFAILLPARFLFIEHFSLMFSKFGIEVNCMLPAPNDGEAMAWFVRDINKDEKVLIKHVYDRSMLEYTEQQVEESDYCVFLGEPAEEESDVDGVSDTESLGFEFDVNLNAQKTACTRTTATTKKAATTKKTATKKAATNERGSEKNGFEGSELELEEGEVLEDVTDKTVDF